VKVGDLVQLLDAISSMYGQEGEVGLLLEMELMSDGSGYPDSELSRVLWNKDRQAKFYKTDHLRTL